MFKISKKVIVSGAIGNALEMYDYVIWNLFSLSLTKEFLPSNSSVQDIYFMFLLSYVIRPIGGYLCGILADQFGRKKVLTFCILVMGICTSSIAFLPSYSQLGVTSVLILLFVRMIQVFSVGGEYISSVSLLIESADKNKKGYYGSWAAVGVNIGMLAASLICLLIQNLMDINVLPEWGWRICFLASVITTVLGVWIRRSIPESFEYLMASVRTDNRSIKDTFKESLYTLKEKHDESFLVFALVWFGVSTTILFYTYAPIHFTTVNHLHKTEAFTIISIGLFFAVVLIPFWGILSDKYGREKIVILNIIFLLLLSYPYYMIATSGSFKSILLIQIIMSFGTAAIFSVTPVFITEIFPISVRCSVSGLLYSVASCLGGGLTPWVAFKLATHSKHYAPGGILLISGFISLIAIYKYLLGKQRHKVNLTLIKNSV